MRYGCDPAATDAVPSAARKCTAMPTMTAHRPAKSAHGSRLFDHRQLQPLFAGAGNGALIACIRMTHDPGRGIVPQDASNAFGGSVAAVADNDQARVLRVPHADAAAVVNRYPRSARSGLAHGVEQRPVGNRIGTR